MAKRTVGNLSQEQEGKRGAHLALPIGPYVSIDRYGEVPYGGPQSEGFDCVLGDIPYREGFASVTLTGHLEGWVIQPGLHAVAAYSAGGKSTLLRHVYMQLSAAAPALGAAWLNYAEPWDRVQRTWTPADRAEYGPPPSLVGRLEDAIRGGKNRVLLVDSITRISSENVGGSSVGGLSGATLEMLVDWNAAFAAAGVAVVASFSIADEREAVRKLVVNLLRGKLQSFLELSPDRLGHGRLFDRASLRDGRVIQFPALINPVEPEAPAQRRQPTVVLTPPASTGIADAIVRPLY